MKTYIVMPHYIVNNELQELAANALLSFENNTKDFKFINVDDGSPVKIDFPGVTLRNKKNEGFAKTCNKGFKWIFENVKEDCYVVCANNDIEVYAGWQKAMQEPFGMFDNVAVTGIIHSRDKNVAKELRIERITNGGLLEDRMQNGGLWMSKKSILEKVGIFDERFERGGYEDVDLFLRMRDTFGMKIVMSGRNCFWHKEGATRWGIDEGGFAGESKGYEERNRDKFADKWGFDYYSRQVWFQEELYNNT